MPQGFWKDSAEFMPILLQGVGLTIVVSVGSLALSTILGLGWALMRVSQHAALRQTSKFAVNIIRGIPIIVQLFYIYFVLPDFGIALSALQAAIIGLGIAYSAYQAENFRAGIEAIDPGQIEAAQSIGMRRFLIMRRVILPQAVRIVLPPYGNVMIMMLKDSSQASTITVAELALQGKLIASSTFKNTSVFTLVALMYLTMSIPLILLVRLLENRPSCAASMASKTMMPATFWSRERGSKTRRHRSSRSGLRFRWCSSASICFRTGRPSKTSSKGRST